MRSHLSINDLIFNVKCIENLHDKAKKEVLEQLEYELLLLAEIKDRVSKIPFAGAYPLPWTFNGGEYGNDETEDVKIRSGIKEAVVRTDSGYYEPDCANAKIITECVNTIWNIKCKLKEEKQRAKEKSNG